MAYFFLVSHPISNPSESRAGSNFKIYPEPDHPCWCHSGLVTTSSHHLSVGLLQCPRHWPLTCALTWLEWPFPAWVRSRHGTRFSSVPAVKVLTTGSKGLCGQDPWGPPNLISHFLSLGCSALFTMASLLFLGHASHAPAAMSLHWLFTLPYISSSKYLQGRLNPFTDLISEANTDHTI